MATPNPDRPARTLHDPPTSTKTVLAALWIAMLFVFAYVDIFAFWRRDVVEGALRGEVPGTGFAINQTFLALSTIYVVVPIVMVVASLLLPARVNRVVNIVVAAIYVVTIAITIPGESWAYYVVGSITEVALLLAVAWKAWTWPTTPE